MLEGGRAKPAAPTAKVWWTGVGSGAERRGYDRDPTHDHQEHRHGEGHEREPWGTVSLDEAAEEFWDILSQIRSAQPDD